MKKFIAMILVSLFIVGVYASAFVVTSPTGWTSSNGLNTMPGQANNITVTPGGGFTFYCEGKGTCYTIDGTSLEINPGSSVGGSFITIEKN
jgi:hypothetical protein